MNRHLIPSSLSRALCAALFSTVPLTSVAENSTSPADAQALDAISVTATRSEAAIEDVPASVVVRDMQQLRRDGFTVGSDEYRGVTGVFFRRGEGDGDEFPFVSFRGSTGTEGSLSLVDGIPLIGLYEETQLNEVPYDAVARIEIVKGPVSALYGRGALYGATNYITAAPSDDSQRVTLAVGSDGFLRGEAAISRVGEQGGGFLLTASREHYDGWREQGGRDISNLFLRGEREIGAATRLIGYVNVNDRESELPNGLPLDGDGQVIDSAVGRTGFLGFGEPYNDQHGALGALRLLHQFNDDLELSVVASARRQERGVFLNFFDPFGVDLSRDVVGYNGFRGDTTQTVQFGEATLNWTIGAHRLIGGISGERSRIGEDIRWSGQNGFTPECGFTFYLVEVDVRTGAVLNRDHPCFVLDDPLTRDSFRNSYAGMFLQDEITLSDDWTLTVGGRYDRFRRTAVFEAIPDVTDGGRLDGEADAFSPKAALARRTSWGQVYVAYGRGFNSNFGATFEWDPVQYARPESRPTTINSIEVGAKGALFDDRLAFQIALYETEQKNRRQIIANPDAENDFTQPGSLISYGDLYGSRGAELSLDVRPREGTRLGLGYSLIDPEWKSYTLSTFSGPIDLSGTTPTGIPRNLFHASIEQQIGAALSLRASVERYGDYFYTLNNEFRDGGYQLLNFGARYQPDSWRGVAVDVAVTNALDQDYEYYFGTRTTPTYAMPGPPRQARLTLTVPF